METERFLSWDLHQSHLQTMLSIQLGQGRFCDVTLACEDGQTVKAHRSILCACSAYFDSILSNGSSGKDIFIILRDSKFDEIKLLIDFMYNGEICVHQDDLESLRKTAEHLQINGLFEAFGSFEPAQFKRMDRTPLQEPSLSSARKRPKIARIESMSASTIKTPNETEIFLPEPHLYEERDTETGDDWRQIVPKTENLSDEQESYDDFEMENQNSTDYYQSCSEANPMTPSPSTQQSNFPNEVSHRDDAASRPIPKNTGNGKKRKMPFGPENFWKNFESFLGQSLPICITKLLSECGFSTALSLKDMKNPEINEMERYINENLKGLVETLDCCHSTTYQRQKVFQFMPGHRVLLQKIISESDNFHQQQKQLYRSLARPNKIHQSLNIQASPKLYTSSLIDPEKNQFSVPGTSAGTAIESSPKNDMTESSNKKTAAELKLNLITRLNLYLTQNKLERYVRTVNMGDLHEFSLSYETGGVVGKCTISCPNCEKKTNVLYKGYRKDHSVMNRFADSNYASVDMPSWRNSNIIKHFRTHIP